MAIMVLTLPRHGALVDFIGLKLADIGKFCYICSVILK